MSAYTLALMGLLVLLVGALLAIRRRQAAPPRGGSAAVGQALAETAATVAPSGPMPLSPPSSGDMGAGAWAMPTAGGGTAEAPSPFDAPEPVSWGDDEIVTAPGWPMPGELDLGWAGPSTLPPESAQTLAMPAAAALSDLAPHVMPDMPAIEERESAMPRWQPSADLSSPEPGSAGPPEAALAPAATAPPAEPVVLPAVEPPVAAMPSADEDVIVWSETREEPPGLAMPTWEPPPPLGAPPADPPAMPLDLDDPGVEVAEVAWLETAASVTPAAAEEIAWHEVAPPAEPAPAPRSGPTPYGRFALGGFAYAPGHQAVAGVTFREPVDGAPEAWRIGPTPAAAPGTLVLELEGLINCEAEDVAVMDGAGFAPTGLGFSVRVTARDAGPFAAAGTYRIV